MQQIKQSPATGRDRKVPPESSKFLQGGMDTMMFKMNALPASELLRYLIVFSWTYELKPIYSQSNHK